MHSASHRRPAAMRRSPLPPTISRWCPSTHGRPSTPESRPRAGPDRSLARWERSSGASRSIRCCSRRSPSCSCTRRTSTRSCRSTPRCRSPGTWPAPRSSLAVLSVVFRSVARGAIVATAIVVAFVAFGHVASVATGSGLDDRAQLVAWGLVVVAAVVYAIRARASLPRVTTGLNVVAGLLVISSLVTILPYELGRARARAERAGLGGPGRGQQHRPPTRHLLPHLRPLWLGRRDPATVRDHERPLRLAAGPGLPRPGELARELPGDRLLARGDPEHALPRRPDAGRRPGHRRPDAGPGPDPGPRGRPVPAGPGLPLLPAGLVVRADPPHRDRRREYRPRRDERVRIGARRDDDRARDRAGLRRVGGRPAPSSSRSATAISEGTLLELRQLRRVSTAPGPKFVFAHILLPHDPYVFHADGSIIPEAESTRDRREGPLRRPARVRERADPRDRRLPPVGPRGRIGPSSSSRATRGRWRAATSTARRRARSTSGSASGNLVAMYLPGSTSTSRTRSPRSTRSGSCSASTSGPTCRRCPTTASPGPTTTTSTTSATSPT